jgi:hypothetical protein
MMVFATPQACIAGPNASPESQNELGQVEVAMNFEGVPNSMVKGIEAAAASVSQT